MSVSRRRRPLSCAAGPLLLAAALGLAGCAGQIALGGPEETTRIATAEPPPTEQPAAPAKPKELAKPKEKSATVRKPGTSTPAAKERPARQAAGRDEASCTGVETCAFVLKAMVSSPDRAWIDRPAGPAVLANGVRLFAYRALGPKLSCRNLATALSEVETAARTFSGPVADVQPEQTHRVRTLSVDVGGELRAERARRCTSQSKEGPIGSVPASPRG